MGLLQSHELRMKQYDSTFLEQAFKAHMCFRGGSGGRSGRGFNRGREKNPTVGRGDGGQHQASDEAHVSFFLIEEEEDLILGIPNVFIVKNMITQLNFA